MSQKQYIIAKARSEATQATVKSQNLTQRYEVWETVAAQQEADYLALQMQRKTGDVWRGFTEVYTLTNGRNRL